MNGGTVDARKWESVSLRTVLLSAQGGFASGERALDGVVQIRMNNVNSEGGLDWAKITRVPAAKDVVEEYRLRRGDVLFNNTNSTELVGKAAYFGGYTEEVVFSNHFTRLRVNDDALDPQFLALWLQRLWQMGVFANICDRWIGQSAVQKEKLLNLLIPLPSLKEQKRIAARAREQMELQEEARKHVAERAALADALASACLRSVFPFELGEVGRTPSGWRSVPLGDVSEIVSGVTLGRKLGDVPTRRVPYLRVANVKDGYLDFSEVKEIEVTEAEFEKWHLSAGDILLTEGGDPDKLGRGTYWSDQIPDCIHQNHIFRVRFAPEVAFPPFVAAQLGSPYGKSYFLRHAKQTTGIASINQKVLRGFPLLLPPISEQRRIAQELDARLSAAAAMGKEFRIEAEMLDHLPAAFLRSAFAGEL